MIAFIKIAALILLATVICLLRDYVFWPRTEKQKDFLFVQRLCEIFRNNMLISKEESEAQIHGWQEWFARKYPDQTECE